jgi:MerR family copper efflux transcriptional regulator
MYIGEIARLTGASAKAIRHYESLGLLGRVERAGAYRHYREAELQQVQLIRQAQGLGFRLAELVALLGGRTGEPDWLALAQAMARKRASIAGEVARLQALDLRLQTVSEEILGCLETTPAVLAQCDLAPPARVLSEA